ncbi:MAG: TIGR02996 domain-containing protein [Polyangiales bacterium]
MNHTAHLSALIAANAHSDHDDDALRSVYADALLDAGDPRGELIRIQCELARQALGPQRSLAQREGELLQAHRAIWLAELGLPPELPTLVDSSGTSAEHSRGSVVVFRRGFVDEAKLTVEEWLAAQARFASRTPLRKLTITHVTESNAAALADLIAQPTLRALAFRGSRLLDIGSRALSSSPLLDSVRALDLRNAVLPPGTLRLFARHRRLQLDALDLGGNYGLGRDDVEALLSASWLPGLRSLSFANAHLGDDAVWTLSRARHFGENLRVLDLTSCGVGDGGAGAIASSPLLSKSLTHLLLAFNRLGEEAVRSFVQSRRLKRLERLDVRHCGLERSQIADLRKRFGERLVVDGG